MPDQFVKILGAHWPYVVVVFGLAITSCIIANHVWYVIIGEVNRKLPDDERFGYLWGYPSKFRKIEEAYRRFYPEGRLLLGVRVLTALMFACMVATAFLLGIIPLPQIG